MLTFEKFEKVIKLKQQFDQHLNDAERVLGGLMHLSILTLQMKVQI